MAFLHGVETIEVQQGARPISVVRSAVIGLIGIAPKGAKNEVTLVQSDTQAAEFGKQVPGFTIPQALADIFKQGAGTVLVVNVFDEATNTVEVAAESVTVDGGKFSIAAAPIGDPVVTSDPAGTTHVKGTDYTFDAYGNFTIISGGGISEGDSLLVTYDKLDISTVTSAQIIGAVDGVTGERSGLKVFDEARNLFGFNPRLLISPGFSTVEATSSALISTAESFKAHALIDAPIGTTVAEAVAGRGPAGTINFNTSSKRAVLCFPHVKAYDPATDSNVNRPLSQFLAGVIAATDNNLGYWHSPSNKQINGALGAEIPLTAAVNDPSTDVNLLNENGILTVFNSFGSGLRTWGNRSAAYPSSTTVDNFIAVQRVADIINESVENSMLQFIDEPITDALIDAIVESVNSFIRTLKGRNAILDGECSYNPDKNPEAQVSAGQLVFDIEFMPPVPGERYTFNSFINIEYLSQLGGNQ